VPYKSLAQERYFNANRGKLEAEGVNINEWNAASKGMKLPKVAASRPRKPTPAKALGTARRSVGGILKLRKRG
jgi:hypothetical protein